MTPLRFYEYGRQSYGYRPIDADAEFMIGEYNDDVGVGEGGEFKITLQSLGGELLPQLHVFGDATGSLMRAIAAGLLTQLDGCAVSPDEFSERLSGLGFEDVSEYPIGSGPRECPCCGRRVEA